LRITSLHNALVKHARKLRDKGYRDTTALFLIEGFRELSRAHTQGIALAHLFFCPECFLGSNEGKLVDALNQQGVILIQCSEEVFAKLSYRDRPDGLLAIAYQWKLEVDTLLAQAPEHACCIVTEAIEKPGNLGSILRSADAAGVLCCLLANSCTDMYNPNVVRASVGALFTVPVAQGSTEEILHTLRRHRFRILATTPHAVTSYHHLDLTGRIALVVGAEQYGLSETWLQAAELSARIPMYGQVDSLNVAVATTLVLYEIMRQNEIVNTNNRGGHA